MKISLKIRIVLSIYFFLGLLPLSYGQCPNDRDFIEVYVRTGVTVYGSLSIKLLYEGLIYRWTDENFKNKSYFVCLDSLDNKKLCNLQSYIYNNKLKYLKNKDLLLSASNIISFDRPKMIDFRSFRENKLCSLEYDRGDQRIKQLIILLISLIPEEDSKYFKSMIR